LLEITRKMSSVGKVMAALACHLVYDMVLVTTSASILKQIVPWPLATNTVNSMADWAASEKQLHQSIRYTVLTMQNKE